MRWSRLRPRRGSTEMSKSKVLGREEFGQRLKQWQRAGELIVLANGNFDLLHVGHVRYLRGAKELGGKLVVAINSDDSVRARKGDGRPVMPAEHRYRHLAEALERLGVLGEQLQQP